MVNTIDATIEAAIDATATMMERCILFDNTASFISDTSSLIILMSESKASIALIIII